MTRCHCILIFFPTTIRVSDATVKVEKDTKGPPVRKSLLHDVLPLDVDRAPPKLLCGIGPDIGRDGEYGEKRRRREGESADSILSSEL